MSHHDDVIMTAMASQITSLSIVYSIVFSGADQSKHQSSASLAFVREFTGEFPAQMASTTENISIWWRHHAFCMHDMHGWIIHMNPQQNKTKHPKILCMFYEIYSKCYFISQAQASCSSTHRCYYKWSYFSCYFSINKELFLLVMMIMGVH